MVDIYAGNNNRSVVIDGVSYAIPQPTPLAPVAKFYDIIPKADGKYDILPAVKDSKAIYTVRVDVNGELRNFNKIGDLTVTLGEYITGPSGAVPEGVPVVIDFSDYLPPNARGIRLTYSGTVSSSGIGGVSAKFSPDGSPHGAAQVYENKQVANRSIQLFGTVDVAFRRQNGLKLYYSTASNEGLDKGLTVTKFLIRGWWL